MTTDLFGSLFELQDSRLDKLGNPLLALEETIDWNAFRKTLNRANKKQNKGYAGGKPKDVVMIPKALRGAGSVQRIGDTEPLWFE